MGILYIYTANDEVREMLEDINNARRVTDSGFDVPMVLLRVCGDNVYLHTLNLLIKVAAVQDNRPMPCLLLPRSSMANTPYRMANSIGLIDSGYRGEVKAKIDIITNGFHTISPRTRLFQICQHNFLPWDQVVIVRSEEDLPNANDNRGGGGFGSTN